MHYTIAMPNSAIAVFTSHAHLQPEAHRLAEQLQLPLLQSAEPHYDYLLVLTPDYLGLQKVGDNSHPLYIDFLSGKMQYRCQHLSLKKEALARAGGLKHNKKMKIVDATAGLAQDSFILACLGFDVTLLERSPLIHALITDGMKRANKEPSIQHLHLIQADAITWLSQCKPADRPDLIYLDPMFPQRKKSALTKLEMRVFHDIIGDDLDAEALLAAALACATQRIVVKRPRLAASLKGPAPHFSFIGKSSRFDVYLIRE